MSVLGRRETAHGSTKILETESLGPARGSGALVREGGEWKIAQYNLALTVPNERFSLVKEAAAAKVSQAAADDPLAELAWLSGDWTAQRSNGEFIEELWTSPRGGTMVGSGRTVRDGSTTFFEYLRIEARPGSIVYVAQPRGGAPTEFASVEIGASSAVFENRHHDWPKRVTYRVLEDGVRVRVEGDPGQDVDEWVLSPTVIARGH